MINIRQNIYIYDIEADGLLDKVTKIHCLSICWRDSQGRLQVKSTTDYNEMRKFFTRKGITRCGHNITLYDERVVAKLLGIDTLQSNDQIIDTLPLSWYLYPEKKKHGLEQWGHELGIKKVEIKDWKNLTPKEYIHRCEEDTKINFKLWEKCLDLLTQLYLQDNEILRFLEYLMFKMDCIREQEDEKIKLNIPHIEKTLEKLKQEKADKEATLESVMPKVPIKVTKTYKNVIVLPTGEFFEKGDMMYDYYFREGNRPKMEHNIDIIKGYKDPNANSTDQKKDWLFSLGWNPEHYKYVKDEETGATRKIPQIKSKNEDGSVCDSVKKLFEKEPKLQVLEGLTILAHRIGLLEGLLKNQKEGYIEASMAGLTNTLRLKHMNIVNLPGVAKKYGYEIRSSLIAEDGGILCGSDMSSLEDTTKQHYMYFYDPKYVMEMRVPGFDPHLDIGLISGLMTQAEVDFYKKYKDGDDKKKYLEIKEKRHKSKTTNFSSIYGVGAEKLARELGIPVKLAKKLLEGYWLRNKAVKQVAESCIVKSTGYGKDTKKWLFNPVSKFWYSLRAEKDRFSTLNQGTGVYCFDQYVKQVRKKGFKISVQMHDEILFKALEKDKDYIRNTLKEAIQLVNDEVKLNVPLGISVDFGINYGEVH